MRYCQHKISLSLIQKNVFIKDAYSMRYHVMSAINGTSEIRYAIISWGIVLDIPLLFTTVYVLCHYIKQSIFIRSSTTYIQHLYIHLLWDIVYQHLNRKLCLIKGNSNSLVSLLTRLFLLVHEIYSAGRSAKYGQHERRRRCAINAMRQRQRQLEVPFFSWPTRQDNCEWG